MSQSRSTNPCVRISSRSAITSRRSFLQLENERVWPRVWLMACREEELEEPGSFVTFDIVRDSILLVRQASGEIKAFHNVCQHRGRRLKDGCGQIGKSIYCRFHGWSWNLDGSIQRIVAPRAMGGLSQTSAMRICTCRKCASILGPAGSSSR